ncbi:MAG: tetratricopeptide repeat protein [Terracidiphilus sp.]|jgi:tetratricopeptide (TPR) repeat protein
MFVAPISKPITSRVPSPKPQIPQTVALSTACHFGMVLVLLLFVSNSAHSQQPAVQFDDLAARAAGARDQGNLPLAIELYSQAEQLRPDWAEGWFYLGLLQYSSNAYPAAIEAFNHLLVLKPGAPPALALRGLCEFETGAFDDSLRDLEEAVAKGAANEPRNEQIIRYHLAQLLARSGRFQDAVTQYQYFASRRIDDPDMLLGLGLAGMRSRMFPKDVPAEDRPIYEAAGGAGYALLAGFTQEADSQFNQLFARYPSTANLHFFYGNLLFPHAPDLAVDQFRAEVNLVPSNAENHAILAFSLMLAGRYSEALPEAEAALAGNPDMEMSQLAMARSLAETGEEKRATDLINHILKLDPNSLEAHMALAVVYARTGRREDAYRERAACLALEK